MMKLSACVIVKNEEKNIGRWLSCMQKLADEIIVVDTGSTDKTCQMAEEAGAKLYHFPWINDFAAAKNFALAKATGSWVAFLDADEFFPDKIIPLVKEKLKKYEPDRKVIGIVCRLSNIDPEDNNRFIGSIGQVRLFRNIPTLQYVGKVHEHLQNSSGKEREFRVDNELEIYHTGYSQRIIKEKVKRNLEILLQKTAEHGEKKEDYLYFMDCYFGLDDYEKAIAYAKKAIAAELRYIGMEGHAENTLIMAMIKSGKTPEEIRPVIEKAVAKYPLAAEFVFRQGLLNWDCRNYLAAEKDFLKGIELYAQQETTRELSSACQEDNARVLLPRAYLYLALIKEMQLLNGEAAELILTGLKITPYDPALFSELYKLLSKEEPAEIIELLNGIYDADKDADFLTEMLGSRASGAVYLYYARRAGRELNSLRSYLAADRADAAMVAGEYELKGIQRYGILAALKQQKVQSDELFNVMLPPAAQEAWTQLRQGEDKLSAEAVIIRRLTEGLTQKQKGAKADAGGSTAE